MSTLQVSAVGLHPCPAVLCWAALCCAVLRYAVLLCAVLVMRCAVHHVAALT